MRYGAVGWLVDCVRWSAIDFLGAHSHINGTRHGLPFFSYQQPKQSPGERERESKQKCTWRNNKLTLLLKSYLFYIITAVIIMRKHKHDWFTSVNGTGRECVSALFSMINSWSHVTDDDDIRSTINTIPTMKCMTNASQRIRTLRKDLEFDRWSGSSIVGKCIILFMTSKLELKIVDFIS